MKILHTESSTGWGGQEMRILREAIGMRQRGHEIFLAVHQGGRLIEKAREEGFIVYEFDLKKSAMLWTIPRLGKIIKQHGIDLLIAHSSSDAWVGGIAARAFNTSIIRTRHLSTPIRGGINSLLLYNWLVDFVVTTSSCILPIISKRAKLDPSLLKCIPTGIDPSALEIEPLAMAAFRSSLGLKDGDLLVGTCCFVRSWKGIDTLLQTAKRLKEHKQIKWVVVGGGYIEDYRPKIREMGLEDCVQFIGHLERPYAAIAAMDIFTLLSTANEGISQASLQAAYLGRPLLTTNVGGLPEVCIDGRTGILVPPFSPEKTAEAVLALAEDSSLRHRLGSQAKALVEEHFTFKHTLDQMETVCMDVLKKKNKRG
jgi:glycosyltransferase involved in cell wall biosynthesis